MSSLFESTFIKGISPSVKQIQLGTGDIVCVSKARKIKVTGCEWLKIILITI